MAENKPLVLVVDDEPDATDNLVEVINLSGLYNAVPAYSAEEAVKILTKNQGFLGFGKNRVSLIVSDIKMPEFDGLKFLDRVRLDFPGIGFIFLTAYEDKVKWEKARQGLVAAYLKKPFKEDEILAILKRFFSGKEDWMVEQTKWELLDKEEKEGK